MNTSDAIIVRDLSKSFRTFNRRDGVWGSVKDLFHRNYQSLQAVDHISFSVKRGELIGYIGPNGAGKSTSIKMLTGILKPTSGEINVLGFDPFRNREKYTKQIGVVFGQRTQLWWDIAVLESFRLLSTIYDVPQEEFQKRLEQFTELFDLKDVLRTPVRKLSLGQRMRCDLAASLLHRPEVLFLDEPTVGLDAVGKDSIRSFLRQINKEFKTTIVLTTHDLQEIEELCERIVIIDKGRIIYDGSLERIKDLPGLMRQVSIDFNLEAPIDELKRLFGDHVHFEKVSERRVVGSFDPQSISTVQLIKEIVGRYEIADFTVEEPNIEEVVMKIYREGVGSSNPIVKNHDSNPQAVPR